MMHGAMSLKNVVMLCEEFKDKLKKKWKLYRLSVCLPCRHQHACCMSSPRNYTTQFSSQMKQQIYVYRTSTKISGPILQPAVRSNCVNCTIFFKTLLSFCEYSLKILIASLVTLLSLTVFGRLLRRPLRVV